MEWTEEAIAKLRTLWAEGLSTAEIGRRLNGGPERNTAERAQTRPGADPAAPLRLDRQPHAHLAGHHAGAEIHPPRDPVLLADR
jgi:hypothetical protein